MKLFHVKKSYYYIDDLTETTERTLIYLISSGNIANYWLRNTLFCDTISMLSLHLPLSLLLSSCRSKFNQRFIKEKQIILKWFICNGFQQLQLLA